MGDATHINPQIDATMINSEVSSATVINKEAASALGVEVGSKIGDKYYVSEMISSSGEADIYLCRFENANYVAKIYRRKMAVKDDVVEKLKKINFPYIAKLYDTGTINGFPYEILPYYRNGSLQGKTFSFKELKDMIIPGINKALRILHQNGIIHKDIKPSNIMLLDNGNGVALIDFGISSITEDGNTVLVTKTGMTPEYSAPETYRNLFLKESDYYSLGITAFELFCGRTPYTGMSGEEIARYTAVQKIPLPDDMPDELKNFINGVTYYDITNREDKSNPNRRWTFYEVDNWCKGKEQPIPGEGSIQNAALKIPYYKFLGTNYSDIHSLVNALALNWNEGKKQLYRGLLSAYFKNFNPELADVCMDAEEESTKNAGQDDLIFWKTLYKLSDDFKAFAWKGKVFESLAVFGRDMLDKLWNENGTDLKIWNDILNKRIISQYFEIIGINDKMLKDAVDALETQQYISRTDKERELNYYLTAYLLSGQKILKIEGKEIKNPNELADYMKLLLERSYKEFEDFCHSMIDYHNNLDVQLEAWLIAIGKRKELEKWRHTLG